MITKMFPELEEVFEALQEEHQQYFFPICSVDLSSINPNWKETIHFILFNTDPYHEARFEFFNAVCSDNSIGFHLHNGKLALAADMSFMQVSDKWKKWLATTKKEYLTAKERYHTPDNTINYPAKIQLGGYPRWVQEDETPVDKDGQPLQFVGAFYSANFVFDYCAKDIYVFYNPKEKMVVQVYQIT